MANETLYNWWIPHIILFYVISWVGVQRIQLLICLVINILLNSYLLNYQTGYIHTVL
jgi:hypothetical protein